jgi:hypothetical protein
LQAESRACHAAVTTQGSQCVARLLGKRPIAAGEAEHSQPRVLKEAEPEPHTRTAAATGPGRGLAIGQVQRAGARPAATIVMLAGAVASMPGLAVPADFELLWTTQGGYRPLGRR